ncbi:MAG: oligosaccharide flippase family protein [Ignavibacteriales bacterium]|nr:oligosaccharide flippase family protein [Ignavibacteriales bacterium]
MKKFVKNWSILTLSNFLYQGFLFFSFVRIARGLKPELYGKFTIIITAVAIAQVFTSLGLQKIVIREIARENSIISYIAKISIKPILIATCISAVILSIYLFQFEKINDLILLSLSLVLLLALTIWNYAEPIAFGIQQMNISAYLNVISSLVFVIVLFIIPTNSYTIIIVTIVYVLIFFLRALIYLFVEWKKNYFSVKNQSVEVIDLKTLLNQSLPYWGTNLLAIPTLQLPILFLGQFSGQQEVGYYGICTKLSMPLTLIANNLLIAVYPVLAKYYVENKSTFLDRTKKIFIFLTVTGIIFTLALGLFSKEIVAIFLGKQYELARPAFSIQVWVTLNLILHSFIATIFLATDKEKILVKLSVFNSVVIGLAGYIGSYYGAVGLSIGAWFGLLVGFSFHWYFVIKKVGLKLKLSLSALLMIYFIGFSLVSFFFVDEIILIRIILFVILSSMSFLSLKSYFNSDLKNLLLTLRYYGR